MPTKKTNKYLYKRDTRSTCPVCRQLVTARVHEKQNKLYMEKFCPEHGRSTALLSSDAAWTEWSRGFNKPGEKPLLVAGNVEKGCPNDCGLCDDHEQHSCSIQIEVTDKCDLTCSNCYMGPENSWFLPKERAEWMFDRMVEVEGNPEIVQLTGGEPTLHPDLLEMAAAAVKRNIKYVLVNTNGNQLARDPDLAKRMADQGIFVYLQFDGFDRDIYIKQRGRDLLDIKMQALENLEMANCQTVLAPLAEKGVNDHQLGQIIQLAVSKKFIKSVSFQPISYNRAFNPQAGKWAYDAEACPDPVNRITMQEMIKKIGEQSEWLEASDFVPVPCHQPACGSVTYLLEGDHGIMPLTKIIQVDHFLDYVKNKPRVDMDEVFQVSRMELEKLWSMSAIGGSDKVIEGIRNLLTRCCGTDVNTIDMFQDQITQVSVHHLMDPHNYDADRARKCCVHFMLPSGKLMPFCNYNVLYRDRYRQEGLDKSMESVPLHEPRYV